MEHGHPLYIVVKKYCKNKVVSCCVQIGITIVTNPDTIVIVENTLVMKPA